MGQPKLLREITAFGWAYSVEKFDDGIWTGEVWKPRGKKYRARKATRDELVEELNRLVRWAEARAFLRKDEAITKIIVRTMSCR